MRMLTLCILFFLPVASLSQVTMGFGEVHILTQALDPDTDATYFNHRSCRSLFRAHSKAHVLSLKFGGPQTPGTGRLSDGIQTNAPGEAKIARVSIENPLRAHQKFFERAMNQWKDHGYNENQVALLRGINDLLPPHRVHWINFKFDQSHLPEMVLAADNQGVAAIRIFDGSTPGPMIMGRWRKFDWQDSRKESSEELTPLELGPKNFAANYRLPQRQTPGRTALWHIGIATNVKKFEGGLNVMFSHVAKLLDIHYNESHYKTFGTVKPLEDLDMWIISSAKVDLVDYYKKYGFLDLGDGFKTAPETTIRVNSNGEAEVISGDRPLLPDGLALIGMRASDFMKRFHDFDDVPHIRVEDEKGTYDLGNKDAKGEADLFFRKLNEDINKTITPINTRHELKSRVQELKRKLQTFLMTAQLFIQKNPSIQHMDQPELDYFKDNSDYQLLFRHHREWAVSFYQLVKGTHPQLRTGDWMDLDNMAISLLTDGPLESLQNIKVQTIYDTPDFMQSLNEAID